MVNIKIKKLHEKAIIPKYVYHGDAGMDLFSVVSCIINKGERKLIPTGLSVEIPIGFEMQIRPKSGLALNHGLIVLNTPGTVDSGYRGEIGIILHNTSDKDYEVKEGEKVAQLVLAKVEKAEFSVVDELSDSDRGKGGYGSTGLK